MKKFRILWLSCLAGLLSLFVICGCEIGMGNAVDLEAPVLKILSPELNANTNRNVELKGTVFDNQKVESVIVYNYFTNEVIEYASISGNEWSAKLYLPEGDQTLKVIATDPANNSSTKSTRVITLHVDESAPEGRSWYIDRGNNIQTSFYSFEDLLAFDYELAANSLIPQNEKFTIKARFYDAMGIVATKLIIEEVEQKANGDIITVDASPLFEETRNVDTYNSEDTSIGTLYMPFFEFTHDQLVTKKSSLATGKHYFRVSYYTEDKAGNKDTVEKGYFLWWPESDIPGIEVGDVKKEGDVEKISVSVGGTISLHFFDDDKLAETAYTFKSSTALAGLSKSNIESRKDSFEHHVTNYPSGTSDDPLSVNVGEATGVYYLAAYVKDDHDKKRTRWIQVTVSDAQKPILVITEPQENQIPNNIEGTTFKIKGNISDTSGCSSIKIAYVPKTPTLNDSASLERRAKELFGDIVGGAPRQGNEKIQNLPLTNKTKDGKFVKESFAFDWNVINDFGDEKNKDKFFLLRVEDIDGNIVYKQFKLLGDTVIPEIIIESPAKDMTVYDYTKQDLVLSFKAEKESGLAIDINKYKITRKKGDSEETIKTFTSVDENGFAKYTIQRATLKNWAEGLDGESVDAQPTFTFYAEDVLGNKASARRVCVLSPLPKLVKIESDKKSGIYNTGTVLKMFAKFSETVKLDTAGGSPRIKLGGIKDKNGTALNNVYATLDPTTANITDTLTFSYTIPQDIKSDKVTVTSSSIELNGASIKTGGAGEGDAIITIPTEVGTKLEDSAILKIDSIKPEISNISTSVLGKTESDKIENEYFVKENDEIYIDLQFTESVLISEKPILKIKNNATTYDFNFQESFDNGTRIRFSYKVRNGDNAASLIFDKKTAFSESDSLRIKDIVNNSLKLPSNSETTNIPVVIDTGKPNKPTVTDLTTGIFNKIQRFEIENESVDAHFVEYSEDGGLTWQKYKDCVKNEYGENVASSGEHIGKVTLSKGDFSIVARQTDKAGNVSDSTDPINLTINSVFPEVSEISIAKNDGNWKKGELIKFNLFFEENVEPYGADDASLTFAAQNDATMNRTVKVKPSAIETNKLVFEYTITEEDDFKGVNITAVDLGNIQDKYNNTQQTETATKMNTLLSTAEASGGTCKRSGLVLDGKPPIVSSFETNKGAISAYDNEAGIFKLTFTFDENIRKESGKIYLQRKGNWAIPSVLTTSEFNNIYNKVKLASDKEKLMQTDDGNGKGHEKTHAQTGQPIGPYKKITHGLKVESGNFVPDTQTKYVLDFNLDIFETTGNVYDIRNVLKGIDYDKHFVEVNTSNVKITDNVLEITFLEDLPDGIEWELYIPNNAFYDVTGNPFAGFVVEGSTGYASAPDTQKYSFFTNKVAKPVIRVDRYSHGWGAVKKNANNTAASTISAYTGGAGSRGSETNTANSGRTVAPWGFVDVKIDCATPGATIKYKVINQGSYVYDFSTQNRVSTTRINNTYQINNISSTDARFNTINDTYTSQFNVGEARNSTNSARYDTARKDYVVAQATKTGYTTSDKGYEGVFKTVVIAGYHENRSRQSNVEGGTQEGGEPIVSGFPVRDATKDDRYSKNMYRYDTNWYIWVSYEIVSDWSILIERTNYSTSYPRSTYGALTYLWDLEQYTN